jgi:hypothetical protein
MYSKDPSSLATIVKTSGAGTYKIALIVAKNAIKTMIFSACRCSLKPKISVFDCFLTTVFIKKTSDKMIKRQTKTIA